MGLTRSGTAGISKDGRRDEQGHLCGFPSISTSRESCVRLYAGLCAYLRISLTFFDFEAVTDSVRCQSPGERRGALSPPVISLVRGFQANETTGSVGRHECYVRS